MSLHARRFAPLALLALLVCQPAEASAAKRSRASVHRGTAKPARHSTRHRRIRSRLPPGGVVWARNAVVLDPATNEILFDKEASQSVPIASLSKLMTMMVFLEQNPDLGREVEVTRDEITGGGHTQLKNHEMVALGDLLHMSLMCSDNVATRVLARESGLSREDFLARMNRKAVELGLARSRFVEFTGLDERNVSTATDCAQLLKAAAANTLIQGIMTTKSYDFRSHLRNYERAHTIANTDRLLHGSMDIRAGKTGFIVEAGYCLATWVHTESRDLIAVVLGAPTAATRFADVQRLVQHTTLTTESTTQ